MKIFKLCHPMTLTLILCVAMVFCQKLIISQSNNPQNNNSQKNKQIQPTNKSFKAKSNKNISYKKLPKADLVEVIKSKQRMYLKHKGKVIRSYHIALGDQPKGHKVREGDERTPEGTYILDWKNENSIAYRSIHISYPNKKDLAKAKKLGVSAGGNIMIHGQMNGYEKYTKLMQKRNWTDGCVAVTNPEMDEIMHLVKVGTKIKIRW